MSLVTGDAGDGGSLVPDGFVDDVIAHARKLRSIAFMSEEMLVDAGYEPPAGYWERQLARDLATRRLRFRIRRLVWRLQATTPLARLGHAIAALRGRSDRCDHGDCR